MSEPRTGFPRGRLQWLLGTVLLFVVGVLIGLVFGVGAPFALIETVGPQLPVTPVAGIYTDTIAIAAAATRYQRQRQ